MGIAPAMVKLLMREGNREAYSGDALTIGRQGIHLKTTQDLQKLAEQMKFQLKSNIILSIPNGIIKNSNYIADTILFLSLGFDSIDSLDISDYEQCTVMQDLNIDVPAELYNKYDLIVDGGSSEHIFNLPKVLENYNRMLKVGGRLIHALPSSNHVDHGFYMFSPNLFWEYYSANNWEIIDSLFFRYNIKNIKELWDVYSYIPGCLEGLSSGGFTEGQYGIYFVVKKTFQSTYNASVQQGSYLEISKDASNSENIKLESPISWKKKIYLFFPKFLQPIIFSLYYYALSKFPMRFQLQAIGLKRIGRY